MSDTKRIRWGARTYEHFTGWNGHAGKWLLFSIKWGSTNSKDGRWHLASELPIRFKRVRFETVEQAEDYAETLLADFLRGLEATAGEES